MSSLGLPDLHPNRSSEILRMRIVTFFASAASHGQVRRSGMFLWARCVATTGGQANDIVPPCCQATGHQRSCSARSVRLKPSYHIEVAIEIAQLLVG